MWVETMVIICNCVYSMWLWVSKKSEHEMAKILKQFVDSRIFLMFFKLYLSFYLKNYYIIIHYYLIVVVVVCFVQNKDLIYDQSEQAFSL